jgi:uncharacterized membrane protein YedE/YeeE
MDEYMTDFTPISALIGGGFIGLSALILMLMMGRVAGCSGILTDTLSFSKSVNSDRMWRLSFVIGLIIGPVIAASLTEFSVPQGDQFSWTVAILGGLVVGIGAAIANGCTSGHGICGMGRLSKRSIVATLTFMFTAFVTVFITQHV